jgi:molybdate-binding protein
MVRKEHASLVGRLSDLVSAELRFVNRQTGSGTRLLMDQLLATESIDPACLPGYEQHIEHTHTAVALCVASGVADAGLGVEAAALQYGLHFVPMAQENYFLACLTRDLERPAVVSLQEILHNPPWRRMLRGLPGYEAPTSPGATLNVDEALPWWRTKKDP